MAFPTRAESDGVDNVVHPTCSVLPTNYLLCHYWNMASLQICLSGGSLGASVELGQSVGRGCTALDINVIYL